MKWMEMSGHKHLYADFYWNGEQRGKVADQCVSADLIEVEWC